MKSVVKPCYKQYLFLLLMIRVHEISARKKENKNSNAKKINQSKE